MGAITFRPAISSTMPPLCWENRSCTAAFPNLKDRSPSFIRAKDRVIDVSFPNRHPQGWHRVAKRLVSLVCYPALSAQFKPLKHLKSCWTVGEPLIGNLLLFDALSMDFNRLKLRQNSDCPMCGENPTIHELIDYEEFCEVVGSPVNFAVRRGLCASPILC